ncbi:MAG: hypothetical protein U0798_15075 [Gemmataceae bacterium]
MLPPGTLIPKLTWPGLTNGVQSFRYDCVHGISPGTAMLVTNPLDRPPAGFGTLVWSDGKKGGALQGCRVKRMTAGFSAGGYVWTLEIQDRRWQWVNGTFPGGGGRYNQLDNKGKLIPWTIRSPVELAALCFAALGEKRFRIEGLPKGLSTNDAKGMTDYLRTGQNAPVSAANPPVNWEGVPPATALAELCDRYGCRVVFQPFQNRVLIAKMGVGKPLPPNGSLAQASLTVDAPTTPMSVGVYGAPKRFQMRLALEPVAREWDGPNHFLRLEDVSYAPKVLPVTQKQIVDCVVRPAFDAAAMKITIIINGNDYTSNGITGLISELQRREAGPNNGVDITQPDSQTIRLTGRTTDPFSVQCRNFAGSTAESRFDARIVQPAFLNAPDWSRSIPPTFPGIASTDRLSLYEARQLARQSVWRCFRVMDEDVRVARRNARDRARGVPVPYEPIIVPGLGPIRNRRQLILTPSMVAQVVPSPRLQGFMPGNPDVALGTLGGGILPEYYNGLSRDQQARVYGQYAMTVGRGVAWNTRANPNAPPMSLLKVGFSIDPQQQVLTFAEPVFKWCDQGGQGIFLDPELILECAVFVRDPVTWMEIRPTFERELIGGVGQPEWIVSNDVIVDSIGEYDDSHRLTGLAHNPEDADGPRRAQNYLEAMAAPYVLAAS